MPVAAAHMSCFTFMLMFLAVSSTVAYMPPKTAARKTKAKGKPKPKAAKPAKGKCTDVEDDEEASDAEKAAGTSKLVQSGFITTCKHATKRIADGTSTCPEQDEQRKKALERYNSLGRFDPEKKALLLQWSKDKSCSWWGHYEESKGSSVARTDDTYEGFGSRFQSLDLVTKCLVLLVLFCCFCCALYCLSIITSCTCLFVSGGRWPRSST